MMFNDNNGSNKGGPMNFGFMAFPLLAINLVIYNVVAFSGVLGGGTDVFAAEMITLTLASGDPWTVTYGDVFVIFGLALLFIELLRATQTHSGSILNHAFSMVIFIVCLLEFVLVPGFGTSTFFIFMMMALLDVMAGFIVTIVTARRDFGVAEGTFGGGS